MKPELQRIKIAEACGKCTHGPDKWEHEGPEGDRELMCIVCKAPLRDVSSPNYPSNLTAMNEAEKVLPAWFSGKEYAGTQQHYYHELQRACSHPDGCASMFEIVTATASQRAEAFLRTLNLWQDEPTTEQKK